MPFLSGAMCERAAEVASPDRADNEQNCYHFLGRAGGGELWSVAASGTVEIIATP